MSLAKISDQEFEQIFAKSLYEDKKRKKIIIFKKATSQKAVILDKHLYRNEQRIRKA